MKNRDFSQLRITKKGEISVRAGHPWVYAEEIIDDTSPLENGSIVDVLSKDGRYLGSGLLSQCSKIRVRILSRNASEKFDQAFFRRRIGYALEYRRSVMKNDIVCSRLVFGEADGLPGVTVDRYGDVLVTQITSYGMELRKDILYKALRENILENEQVEIKGIYERNEGALREREGLERCRGWADGTGPESPVLIISENGIKYEIDVENGQKTGYYLDQKYNRKAAASLARGRRVLDCFTHVGSFALNCAAAGAEKVTAVDVSSEAIGSAKRNAELNGLTGVMEFVCSDVFEYLPKMLAAGASFDYIILDPPAFTKSRKTSDDAERGYKEINYRAMKLLPRGGYLATCSCSHFMETERFRKVVKSAADDAERQLMLIEERHQSPDHPVLLGVPETDYLKFFIFRVI